MAMLVKAERCQLLPGENIQIRKVCFRTLGYYPLAGATGSETQML